MLTAYDYPLAALIDAAGIDMILVGDSLANVVLGLKSTKEVGMTEMLHHAKAVSRAVQNALIVGDMPFEAYQRNPKEAVKNAKRFITEAGCQAVKVEWFEECVAVVQSIVKAGIPVMGHVGLTPQTADRLGGFKVQGKDADSALRIIENAKALQSSGCFSVVLECIPDKIAEMISKQLSIPTIGIGAGAHCDGQVLVTYDLLGILPGFHPKFVKQYVDLSSLILRAVRHYKDDVQKGTFPEKKHSFQMDKQELESLKNKYWANQAVEAEKDGYLGPKESSKFLKEKD